MSEQLVPTESARDECEQLLAAFCDRFPNEEFRSVAYLWLQKLFVHCDSLSGQPAGWAGGVAYAVKEWTPNKCVEALNADLEEIFGISMSVIRKRADQIWKILATESGGLGSSPEPEHFTLRDEANAICALAFRNGPIEDIHASVDSDDRPRITDAEMKHLMIQASESLAKLLTMKEDFPEKYHHFIRKYNRMYCSNWER